MATNLITVKDVQEKSKDGSTWLELVDQNNQTHRIFRRVQDNDGNWHDLSAKYDMLRTSQNRTLKLTTEQKGRFTNVVDVEQVESAFAQEPTKTSVESSKTSRTSGDREQECRLKTFTTAYAKDLAVAGKIPTDNILGWSELFYRYVQGEITVSDDELNEVIQKAKAMEQPAARPTTTTRKPTEARSAQGVAR